MPTVAAMIERIFPDGTNPRGDGPADRTGVPRWPPDAFAIAATLVGRSGCYSRPEFTGLSRSAFDGGSAGRARRLGRRWAGSPSRDPKWAGIPVSPAEDPELFGQLEGIWRDLVGRGDRRVSEPEEDPWWHAAFRLMAIADEACRGIGFASLVRDPDEITRLMAVVHRANLARMTDAVVGRFSLPYVPRSLCLMVPPDEACVHPKTRSPRAGFTLRSLSHYLALVPPVGEVEATWRNLNEGLHSEREAGSPLNVLLVPFPYHIPDGSIRVGGRTIDDAPTPSGDAGEFRSFFFDAYPEWLRHRGREIAAADLIEFLAGLVQRAEESLEGGRVDIMVLPELALESELAREVAAGLAKVTCLNAFVSGVLQEPGGSRPINAVDTYILFDHEVLDVSRQAKHHRWKIDPPQARAYRLGPAFEGHGDEAAFWERIDITRRSASFWVFRPGISVAALVCEDLARVDPVHSYIRSIGPTLVIALLMDSAQRQFRWPGRYATTLGDDPGSSVLTLTSLGMIRRAVDHYDPGAPQAVAFWAGAERPRELLLEPDCHALLLSLEPDGATNYTLDGRSDDGRTVTLRLPGRDEAVGAGDAARPPAGHRFPAAGRRIVQVRHPSPPQWLGPDLPAAMAPGEAVS